MEYLSIILTVAFAHLLAVIAPGPDFLMITRNSLVYSRRTGMYSAIGLSLGILVHIFYSLVGIGLIIAKSIILFNTIKILGAAYLIYLGYKSLTAKSSKINLSGENQKQDISRIDAIRMGVITNVTNPKVTLFFLSLFTLVITPSTPLFIKTLMASEIFIVTFAWFAFVAWIVSHHLVKTKISKVQHFAEKLIGVVLITLGLKVAFSTSK